MRAAGLIALVAAAASVAYRLTPEEGLVPLSPIVSGLAMFGVAVLLLAGLAHGASGPRRGRAAVLQDLAVTAPAFALLALVGLTPEPILAGLIAFVAAVVLGMSVGHDPFRTRLDAEGRGALDTFALGLLALTVLVGVHYLTLAPLHAGNRDNDAAYYFGVARWIARTGTLDEPIIWHWLTRPDTVVHPAFDYWQGLPSLVLSVPLALVGDSHAVAAWTMGFVSLGGWLLFAWLVVREAPLGDRACQVAALVAFAYAGTLRGYRFDTESVPFSQWAILGALVALARGRTALAVLSAGMGVWIRSDGMIAFGAIALYANLRASRRRLDEATLFASALVPVVYVILNVMRFGTPAPPGAALAPRLESVVEMFLYPGPPLPDVATTVWNRLSWFELELAGARLWELMTVPSLAVRPGAPVVLVVLAALGVLTRLRPPRLVVLAGVLLAALSWLALWLAPGTYSPLRTHAPLVPLLVLALFGLASALLARVGPLARAGLSSVVLSVALACAVPYRPAALSSSDIERDLAALDGFLDGAPVGTSMPWWVIANTRSPAVLLPLLHDSHIVDVVRRYELRYLVFSRTDRQSWGGPWDLWAPLRRGVARFGPYRLVPVAETPSVIVHRVELRN